ncbi:MAG TPA: 5-deoxy-glucuronate isomerase [Candidatus Limnocylindrales bacterium]|nr:5-deoxy-glucuronate isomerase [Candidatus Limnocylindrales bacterium]
MTELRIPSETEPDHEHRVLDVTAERAGWKYVGFEVVRLKYGEPLARDTGRREACLVWLAGTSSVLVGTERWDKVGKRKTVFDGPPHAVYAPPATPIRITAGRGGAQIAIGWAPAERGPAPQLIKDARVEQRGEGAAERTIHQILMDDGQAERLLVTEVLTPAGHWSSFPPHKHDTDDPPNETYLEEIYYFRMKDPRGFALQRVYTADRTLDESLAAKDGDLVLVPRGYHTVSAAPGYDAYYLNVMAGPRREWKITFDPDHERMRW